MQPLDPDRLRVDHVHGQWCLRDDRMPLFRFGPHKDDAQKAVDVIRRYGFTQIGHLGHPTPILLYFAAGPKNPGPGGGPAARLTASKAVQSGMATPLKVGTLSQAGFPPAGSLLPVGVQPGGQPATVRSVLPGVQVLSERVPLDWRQVQLSHAKQEWKLGFGGYTLANFGKDEHAAQQALAAVQYYRFSEHCLSSGPSSFGYFLCNGQAPRGLPPGVRSEAFRPEASPSGSRGRPTRFAITPGCCCTSATRRSRPATSCKRSRNTSSTACAESARATRPP